MQVGKGEGEVMRQHIERKAEGVVLMRGVGRQSIKGGEELHVGELTNLLLISWH